MHPQVKTLSARQRETLTQAAQGKSARVTGELFGISKRTVDQHIQDAVRKLGAKNKTHAVVMAIKRGIIK
jgi:DNA-binding CsgD family transcriptional regulator